MGRGSLWTPRCTPSRRRSWRAPASSCLTTSPSVWRILSGTEIYRMKQKRCLWDLRSGRHLNNQPVESVGKHKDDECLQLPVQAGGAGRGQAHQLDKGLQMFGRGGGGCGHAAEAGAAQAGRCLHRGEVPPRDNIGIHI